MAEDDRNPNQVAYRRRNRNLNPQIVRCGQDHQDWSGLVVQAPPFFIQEKVQPKVLIDDLPQRSKELEIAPSPASTAKLTGTWPPLHPAGRPLETLAEWEEGWGVGGAIS